MPRARGQQGTWEQRNGIWRCTYREYVALPDGTQEAQYRVKTFPGLSRRAAETEMQTILASVNATNKTSPAKKKAQTLSDVVNEWRQIVAVNLKSRGRETAESHLRAHIIPRLGSCSLSELTTKRIQQFVAEITPGRSGKMVENIVLTLTGILRRARKWYANIPDVSISDLSMPEKIKSAKQPPSAEQVKRLIAEAPQPLKTILQVIACTGLRVNESLALCLDDLDFETKTIHVRHSLYSNQLESPKSQASQADIPMSDFLAKKLRLFIQSADYRKNERGLLFCNRRGRAYSDNKLREKMLRPLLLRLNMYRKGNMFHILRHYVGSQMLNLGAPITVVRDTLGHSDVRVTLGIYGHVVGNAQRDAVNRLSEQAA